MNLVYNLIEKTKYVRNGIVYVDFSCTYGIISERKVKVI